MQYTNYRNILKTAVSDGMFTSFIVDEHVLYLNISTYYTVELEFLWWGVILHSTVKTNYSKTVFKRYKHDLDLIANCISQPLYTFHTASHDIKKKKFIKRLGFTYHHSRFTETGEIAKIYHYQPLIII